MKRHWSDKLQCQCGMTFRTAIAEARHRHNFPILCRRPKISEAGRRLLETIPDDWASVPTFGDTRPRRPIIRAGYVETREIDATPPDWPTMIKCVRQEWRRTDKGRAIL